jgi:3-phenylpropionate/cinnamic acid dioxygenase small subunit
MSYVNEDFYERLARDFSDWQDDAKLQADPRLITECAALLQREARLLDQQRFDEWLALFSPECLLWIPATPGGGDPRREVAIVFDDRRRLEDRIFRLRTGAAWSQAPASRTVRLLSNIEVFGTQAAPFARSNFLISEFRAGETRLWPGWCGYRLRRHASSGLQIEVKQLNLLECDQNLRNPSFLL